MPTITILGLGSLLSERSARVTFPTLSNFRLVRVPGYRRIFAHTPSIFVQRGIANTVTLEMASLSAEPVADCSYVATAFEVDDEGRGMDAFREREEEFDLRMVHYTALDGDTNSYPLTELESSSTHARVTRPCNTPTPLLDQRHFSILTRSQQHRPRYVVCGQQ